jgi:hypothetical protein
LGINRPPTVLVAASPFPVSQTPGSSPDQPIQGRFSVPIFWGVSRFHLPAAFIRSCSGLPPRRRVKESRHLWDSMGLILAFSFGLFKKLLNAIPHLSGSDCDQRNSHPKRVCIVICLFFAVPRGPQRSRKSCTKNSGDGQFSFMGFAATLRAVFSFHSMERSGSRSFNRAQGPDRTYAKAVPASASLHTHPAKFRINRSIVPLTPRLFRIPAPRLTVNPSHLTACCQTSPLLNSPIKGGVEFQELRGQRRRGFADAAPPHFIEIS